VSERPARNGLRSDEQRAIVDRLRREQDAQRRAAGLIAELEELLRLDVRVTNPGERTDGRYAASMRDRRTGELVKLTVADDLVTALERLRPRADA
jgi:hypothetical protein